MGGFSVCCAGAGVGGGWGLLREGGWGVGGCCGGGGGIAGVLVVELDTRLEFAMVGVELVLLGGKETMSSVPSLR